MMVDFHITDETTGEVVIFKDDHEYTEDPHDRKPNLFIWEEGNYACDCNRGLFFGRGKGVSPELDLGYLCGESRYSVLGYDRETGALVLSDRRPSSKTRG